jgi:hypothetical protein
MSTRCAGSSYALRKLVHGKIVRSRPTHVSDGTLALVFSLLGPASGLEPSVCPDAVRHVRVGAEGRVGIRSTGDLVLWEDGVGSPWKEGHGALSARVVSREDRGG